MNSVPSAPSLKPPPDRWWLTSIITAIIVVIAANAVLYLPARFSWMLFPALVVFVITYRLHPARWYRRRAEAAMYVAGITTFAPGLTAVLKWGPDSVAGLIIESGWPAIVLPWLAAMWFGWLDYLSRRQPSSPPSPGESDSASTIHQEQTGITGGIKAKKVTVHIHQETHAGQQNEAVAPANSQPTPSAPGGIAKEDEPQVTALSVPIADSKLLRHGAKKLIGRGKELARLTRAWNDPKTHVVSIVAWGGVGKTALTVEWMGRFAQRNWDGVDSYFDWSFYSQGTRDQSAASADTFIDEALRHFGDKEMAAGNASPRDKGIRLAQLVAKRKSLLILDGLEPLQDPPGNAGLDGKLKDPAIEVLLRSLAQKNMPGLCVLTTREPVNDLRAFHDKTVSEWNLDHLSDEAGAELLHRSGAIRAGSAVMGPNDRELLAACREVNGHALTLQLLGSYLGLAHGGDVRKRDIVNIQEADGEVQGGHAFRVIKAYEVWMGQDEAGETGARQLAVLRLLGLFDRPADIGCLAALRCKPVIKGLTKPLMGLSDAQWNAALHRLAELGLITLDIEDAAIRTSDVASIDAHPLLREYFASRLQEQQLKAWRAAHRRLYEHLTETTEHWPDTLDGLQPLYQALAHGCQAGLHKEARRDVYVDRILRGTGSNGFYSTKKLGAFGTNLGAMACFFKQPWSQLSPNLSETDQAWMLNEAGFYLRALGRLTEAVEPIRAGLEKRIDQEAWKGAGRIATNLSQVELALGDVGAAVTDGKQSVVFADRSGDAFLKMGLRTVHADALHQEGRRKESLRLFRDAEVMQAEQQPEYPRLYSVQGLQYCDLLLAEAERAAWRIVVERRVLDGTHAGSPIRPDLFKACDEVAERATQTLAWTKPRELLLPIALDHHSLGRATLYGTLLDEVADGPSRLAEARKHLDDAVEGLRKAGAMDYVPRGLLTRAWLRQIEGDESGARDDLDEAWEIAERGPMRLHMADIQLTRARLFRDKKALAEARKLIEQCGYHRRDEELADAERAAEDW